MKQRVTNNPLMSRLIGILAFSGALILSGNSSAAPCAIEGVVKDGNGHAISGADVRLEARNSGWNHLVKSDARGHYTYDGLTPNVTYRVTLIINGTVKASINNVLVKVGATELNFDLKGAPLTRNRTVVRNGKRYIYIPTETGSHLGGRWVEVDENGQPDSAGVNNVERAGSEAIRRIQSNSGSVGAMPGSGH